MAKTDGGDADVVRVKGATVPRKASKIAGLMGGVSDKQDYGADADKVAVTEDGLAALRALAAELVTAEREVELADAEAKRKAQVLADIQENRLPKMMALYDMKRFDFNDTTTGLTHIIKYIEDIRVQLPTRKEGNKFVADPIARLPIWAWLKELGQGGVVKKVVEMPVGFMKDEEVADLMASIKKENPTLDIGLTEEVHAGTFKALVKRLREEGKAVPEAVKVTPFQVAKVVAK